jgi:FG-GAP repeat
MYTLSKNDWGTTQNLSGVQTGGLFGASVGMTGESMLVGAPGELQPDLTQRSGSVYSFLYSEANGNWSLTGSLPSPNATFIAEARFGASLAVSRYGLFY